MENHDDISMKAIQKICPDERAGVLADYRGNTVIMEFSELDYEMVCQRNEHGELLYKYGFTFDMLIRCDVVFAYCNPFQFNNQYV